MNYKQANDICSQVSAPKLRDLLANLYSEQLRLTPNAYLKYHSSPQAIASRVNGFLAYCEFLPVSGRILDWGCQHAADACMVKGTLISSDIELVGCDFLAPNFYSQFWDYCGLQFVELNHHVSLPFENDSFDCVIGGGVLEHTAMDYESLKELYRILKPGGHLVITHLPNKFSYVEFVARNFRRYDYHHRLYTVSSISSMLKHTGFLPMQVRPHRLLPTNQFQLLTRLLSRYETMLERIWPINVISGDILVIAKKVSGF